MNRTLCQLLSILVLLVCLLTCVPSRSFAQAGWTQPTVMPTPRAGFGAAVGPDGRIYVVGGQFHPDYYDTVSPVDIYDPAKNIWTKGTPLPTSRVGLSVVAGPDGLIYAIGGVDSSGNIVATVEAYNTVTDTWTTVTSLPQPILYETSHATAVGSDGLIYSIGGRPQGNPSNTVLAYDVKAKTWITRMPAPYMGDPITIAAGPDGKIYAGFGVSGGFAAYDPVANTWTTLPSLPNPRNQSAVVTGQDGLIYVIGGRYYYSASFTEVDAYDPVTSRWASAPALPKPSYYMPVVSIGDGRLFAFATDEAGDASSLKARVRHIPHRGYQHLPRSWWQRWQCDSHHTPQRRSGGRIRQIDCRQTAGHSRHEHQDVHFYQLQRLFAYTNHVRSDWRNARPTLCRHHQPRRHSHHPAPTVHRRRPQTTVAANAGNWT